MFCLDRRKTNSYSLKKANLWSFMACVRSFQSFPVAVFIVFLIYVCLFVFLFLLLVPSFPLSFFSFFSFPLLIVFFSFWQRAHHQPENTELLQWVVRSSYMEQVRCCRFSVVLSVTVVGVVGSR